ncbi:MAG: hypothetical protein PHY40_03665 [Patescibacteria group bacterium]|nr:hypothetical protein [Patescibacteria group bacterium]
MAKNTEQINYGKEIISWEVHENEKHERGNNWYIFMSIVASLLLIYCFYTANFLFAVIIILAAIVIVTADGQESILLNISLTTEGIIVGRKFYDYDEIKNFSIIYKPRLEIKNLYFEFKNPLKHRLSIPLNNMNPLPIRENLLKYLSEDLERTDQPVSEALGKLFKL